MTTCLLTQSFRSSLREQSIGLERTGGKRHNSMSLKRFHCALSVRVRVFACAHACVCARLQERHTHTTAMPTSIRANCPRGDRHSAFPRSAPPVARSSATCTFCRLCSFLSSIANATPRRVHVTSKSDVCSGPRQLWRNHVRCPSAGMHASLLRFCSMHGCAYAPLGSPRSTSALVRRDESACTCGSQVPQSLTPRTVHAAPFRCSPLTQSVARSSFSHQAHSSAAPLKAFP